MESRSIYLRVAELLRAGHEPITESHFPHSELALTLRLDVLDSEHRFQAGLAYTQALAALHAHPNADVQAGSETVKRMYLDALAEIPYLTGGRSGTEAAQDDRKAAVQRYHDMRKRLMKEGVEPTIREYKEQIRQVGKSKHG